MSTAPSKPITREAILREAEALIGVPFHHQGKDPAAQGVDCRGLLMAIAARLGYQVSREYRNNYSRNPDPVEFRQGLENELELLASVEEALPADVFLIRFPRQTPQEAIHVGILAEGPYEPMLIHALANAYEGRVTKEPLRRWRPYLVDAFRFRGLN